MPCKAGLRTIFVTFPAQLMNQRPIYRAATALEITLDRMLNTAWRIRYMVIAGSACLGWPIEATAQGQGSWGGATRLAGAIGTLLLIVVLMVCGVTGFIGYKLGHPTRYKPIFALAGALVPIVAIVLHFVNHESKSNEARAALIEANQAVIRVAQARIEATCAELQARETRSVDLQRSLQWRVTPRWGPLIVPQSAMDWPLPLDRVGVAFDSKNQNYLRGLRFEQPYFERHSIHYTSKQLDYIEHTDSLGLYALTNAAVLRTLLPRLDEENRQELSRYTTQDQGGDHSIGFRPRKPFARYALDISDVSTREDRSHWTARLRAKVVEITYGDELFEIERSLPILIDSLGNRTGEVRLCARKGHDAVAEDRNFDWLGYLAREVSTEPRS